MKKLFILLICIAALQTQSGYGQVKAISSAILNFGSNNCGDRYGTTFSMIGTPLTSPYLMASCNINPPFGDVFGKFIAYNPRDNKVYINDISNGDSRLYIYDVGLPTAYTCPATMPMTPTYQYLYVPNNFEFDINGDVWSIRDLQGSTATIERIDEATGTILFSKTLVFPSDNTPNTLSSGDIVLTPNGRMFIVMGDSPGRFYEITNYNTALGVAKANFIQAMPRPCYGILYINGTIELTGTDFGSSCYRYVYDLGTTVMGPQQPFQLGFTPVDNSSVSPATGLSKKLIGSTNIDSTTADIVYEIYAKNLGNVRLNNFNIIEDLGAVFGPGNVSNVSASVVQGVSFPLNTNFDGVTDTKIFTDGNVLNNRGSNFTAVRISLRATNLIANNVYWNTAKSVGNIGSAGLRVNVLDSSNNGGVEAIDPNADGDAGDVEENKPTPYFFGNILPVRFISIAARRLSNGMHQLQWTIAPPPVPLSYFEVEYSYDQRTWKSAGTAIGQAGKQTYELDATIYTAQTIYYRVKAYESTGKYYQSNEAVLKSLQSGFALAISPNPADNIVTITDPNNSLNNKRSVQLIEMTGRKLLEAPFQKSTIKLNTENIPDGYYILNVIDGSNTTSNKLLIQHRH